MADRSDPLAASPENRHERQDSNRRGTEITHFCFEEKEAILPFFPGIRTADEVTSGAFASAMVALQISAIILR